MNEYTIHTHSIIIIRSENNKIESFVAVPCTSKQAVELMEETFKRFSKSKHLSQKCNMW